MQEPELGKRQRGSPWGEVPGFGDGRPSSHAAASHLEIVAHQALMDLLSPFLPLIIPPLGRYRFAAAGCLLVFRRLVWSV